jgi:putative peptidoglycan lipid II flippase
VYRPIKGWVGYLIRLGAANVVMALLLIMAVNTVGSWSDLLIYERVVTMAVVCCLGGAVYLLVLLILGVRMADFRSEKI